jgi:hypothetical protein
VQTTEYVDILNRIFQIASDLEDFGMSFGCIDKAETFVFQKSCVFFKQTARTMPVPHFRRLALSHLITRKKYLKIILRSCKTTLEALTLDCITFTAISDEQGVEDILMNEFNLKEVTFRRINCSWRGMCYGRINQLRFECRESCARSRLDNEKWVYVEEGEDIDDVITLKADEGDDVKLWLSEVSAKCRPGKKWDWDSVEYYED